MIRYLVRTPEQYIDHAEVAETFYRLTRLRGRQECWYCAGDGSEPLGADGPMVACVICNGRPIRVRRHWRTIRTRRGAR